MARAVSAFRWAAEEARRFSGELQRLDTDAGGSGRSALVRRFPSGPVLGDRAVQLPAEPGGPQGRTGHRGRGTDHPEARAGDAAVRPAARRAARRDRPAGRVLVGPAGRPTSRMPALVQDERLPVISFTGSGAGRLRDPGRRCRASTCTLELGGNAAAVVCADYSSDADLDWAATRIATFANYQGGQSCVSVQRVLIDGVAVRRPRCPTIVDGGRPRWRPATPSDEATDRRPAGRRGRRRAGSRAGCDEAVDAGATVLTGGTRDGATYAPTVLVDVPAGAKLCARGGVRPGARAAAVDGVDEAFAAVNDSRYGLQAGVFTHDLQIAFRAHRELEVGGVVVGDVPSFRADQMPYGGVKAVRRRPRGRALRDGPTTPTSRCWCSPTSRCDRPGQPAGGASVLVRHTDSGLSR